MNGLGQVQLRLAVGSGRPTSTPKALMRALRGVTVTQHDNAPSTFELIFRADDGPSAATDFAVSDSDVLDPFSRAVVDVIVDGTPTTIMDGFITGQQHTPSHASESLFRVTGEDVSVKMDIIDYSREFPTMPDAVVVETVLAPWLVLGIVPEVIPSVASLVPFDHVPQQAGTDRQMVQKLAHANGCVFNVRPSSLGRFSNTAYWGPPRRSGRPQALLDVAVGPTSTVDSIDFTYDARAPKTYFGYVMETEIDPFVPIPVLTTSSDRSPALASRPALTAESLLELTTRKELWRDTRLNPVRALTVAQACTNVSTDGVVTATCQTDVARLGRVVTAPGIVGVRGTGHAYDGLYYVKSAEHRIELREGQNWSFTQSLTITREGVGSTTKNLEAS